MMNCILLKRVGSVVPSLVDYNGEMVVKYIANYKGEGITLSMAFDSKDEVMDELKIKIEIIKEQKKLSEW